MGGLVIQDGSRVKQVYHERKSRVAKHLESWGKRKHQGRLSGESMAGKNLKKKAGKERRNQRRVQESIGSI